jgi:hypothetical protein
MVSFPAVRSLTLLSLVAAVLWDLHRLIAGGQVDASLVPEAVADAFRYRVQPVPKSLARAASERLGGGSRWVAKTRTGERLNLKRPK